MLELLLPEAQGEQGHGPFAEQHYDGGGTGQHSRIENEEIQFQKGRSMLRMNEFKYAAVV